MPANFSQFGEFQFLILNLPKKDFRVQYQEKLNLRIIYFNLKKYYDMAGFRQFLGDFNWFQAVPRFSKYVFMKMFCFMVMFSETLVIYLSQNHHYLFFSQVPLMLLIKKILICLTYMLNIKERPCIQVIEHQLNV